MKSHIIPTFILKGFTEDTKDKSSHLFLYRKDLNKIKKKHPNNCFWEEDYFISPRIDENDRGNDSKEVENKLSGLESKMADLVKKMSEINNNNGNNSIHLNTKERDTLILFFVSMDRRNRYSQQESRDFSNNSLSREEKVEELVKDYIHEYNQQDKDSEENREFLSFCIKNSPTWELEEGKKTLKDFHTEEETKNRLAQELHSLMNNPDDLDESLILQTFKPGCFFIFT
ncbi:MAG: DUF4238 domain-containing protein [Flavobacteriaceae bacterium]|nr:DUF4238 domain-containing protein [Flavobacteriaceae bacterium]MCY4267290.1 DUF4238 domain-containing protein [Flavobacteriaceae bacterium]